MCYDGFVHRSWTSLIRKRGNAMCEEVTVMLEKRSSGRPRKRPAQEEFVAAMQSHTTKEVAEMFQVKPGTVRNWASLVRHGTF